MLRSGEAEDGDGGRVTGTAPGRVLCLEVEREVRETLSPSVGQGQEGPRGRDRRFGRRQRVEASVDVDDGWLTSLLDRSTGKVGLGRLGRSTETQTLFRFLRAWNNGRHLRFEDRMLQGKAQGPALLPPYACVLRGGRMGHGGASKQAGHTRTSTMDEDQSRPPPGPAGDGAACLAGIDVGSRWAAVWRTGEG